jgi:hypothetical protein
LSHQRVVTGIEWPLRGPLFLSPHVCCCRWDFEIVRHIAADRGVRYDTTCSALPAFSGVLEFTFSLSVPDVCGLQVRVNAS